MNIGGNIGLVFTSVKVTVLVKAPLELADYGYQGLQKVHANTLMSRKQFKKNPLSRADKQFNQTVYSLRILSENVFSFLKRFKIIADRYRNRRKRFALRFSLISAIYHCEISYVM